MGHQQTTTDRTRPRRAPIVAMTAALLLGTFALPSPTAAAGSGAGDLPADTSTWGVVEVDGSVEGELRGFQDVDWYRVELNAGLSYQIDMLGGWTGEWVEIDGSFEFVAPGTLHDPKLLGVYDENGEMVPGSDNEVNGAGFDSRIESFVPSETGAYFIAVSTGRENGAGTYVLIVAAPVMAVEAVDPPEPQHQDVDETPPGPPNVPEINEEEHLHMGMVKLSWDAVDGANSYGIQFKRLGEWIELPNGKHGYDAIFDGSQVTVDGLGDRPFYEFRLRAVNDLGSSDWSRSYVFSPSLKTPLFTNERPQLPGAPGAPTELDASMNRHNRIELAWSAPTVPSPTVPGTTVPDPSVESYRIEFAEAGSDFWSTLTDTAETSYTHGGMSEVIRLRYRVSARNSHGRGRTSDSVGGVTIANASGPPSAPVHVVPHDWPLLPDGQDWQQGDQLRLMFITADHHEALSSQISYYNRIVRDAAENGHEDIRPYSGDFRIVGSTRGTSAKHNTATYWTDQDRGVPIYWLAGSPIADDYADFYDGLWHDPRWNQECGIESCAAYAGLDEETRAILYTDEFDETVEHIYTNELGHSMAGELCHGWNWQGNMPHNKDPKPCVATGSTNSGELYFQPDEGIRCSEYSTLGNECDKVSIGRPTRLRPEEAGHQRQFQGASGPLNFSRRQHTNAHQVYERPDGTLYVHVLSDGYMVPWFFFYAMSPVFEVGADPNEPDQDPTESEALSGSEEDPADEESPTSESCADDECPQQSLTQQAQFINDNDGGLDGVNVPDPGSLAGFSLVKGGTGTELAALRDGMVIDPDDYDANSFAFRVNLLAGKSVGSVKLALTPQGGTSTNKTESWAPYSLYGDDGYNSLAGRDLPAGEYTLTAAAYTLKNGNGGHSGTITIAFTVPAPEPADTVPEPESEPADTDTVPESADPGSLAGFSLVKGGTGTELAALRDGMVIDPDDYDANSFAFRVNLLAGKSVGSVKLALTPQGGTSTNKTESWAPYSLYGDDGYNSLAGRDLPAGQYTLTATAYTLKNGNGGHSGTITIAFTVTDP